VQSSGYNILGSGTLDVSGTGNDGLANTNTGNQVGVNPGLGALADNGGPTMTQAISEGSPAQDASDCVLLSGSPVGVDQRGFTRPATCDVGSFEVIPPAPPVKVSVEPPGGNCPSGGVKIEVGTDSDSSGTLDPSEVTATEYACNGQNTLVTVSDE